MPEPEAVLGRRKEREALDRLDVLGTRMLGLLMLGGRTLDRRELDRLMRGVRTMDRLELDLLTLGVRTLGLLTLGVRTLGVRTLLELLDDLGAR